MFFHFQSRKIIKRDQQTKIFNRTFAVWEVCRDDEFSPLKNGSGAKDTAATCRRDLMLQHVRWLEQAGANLPSDITQHMYDE